MGYCKALFYFYLAMFFITNIIRHLLQLFRYIVLPAVFLILQPVYVYPQAAKRVLNAHAAEGKIAIDGKLNEPAWQKADKATGFTQLSPNPGQPSGQRTEVSILYDNDAVYIGAMMYDTSPDSILKQLSARDEDGSNADAFSVSFDTYLDKQNASLFVVTASGVQLDAILKFDAANLSWNAPWYSKVNINDKGWSVEIKIPYSSLRFPKKVIQQWGVNFCRQIRRTREKSYWNVVKPDVSNVVGQSGILDGIHDVISPVRLALLPYVSAYAQNYSGANTNTLNGGLDIKYGFNESFTLDMTIVPDFGQTLYDNTVLNLSPIEVKYDERRYFFTEGLDIFNKNDLFYSRRVGGAPVKSGTISGYLDSNEIVTQNPATTKLYNATKISGRTKHNLGIGFFNAISAPAYATVEYVPTDTTRKVETAPLTNYNVIVLDQALKNNSYLSFVNTNVSRQRDSYNADVTALLFRFSNKSNTYATDGSGDVSQLYYTGKPDVGYRYYFDVGKTSSNYTWLLSTKSISDRFNPNDLGYLDKNNLTYYYLDQNYNTFKPFWVINNVYNHVGIGYSRTFNPDVFMQFDINGSHSVTLKNYLSFGVYWDLEPLKTYDYYEPRTLGRFYVYPENYYAGAFISSDYRKKFALDVNISNKWFSTKPRNSFYWAISPRYRFNDKLSMVYSISGQNAMNDVGYVDKTNDSTIYFGVRNVNTITNALDASYIFTNTMSLKLSARHYWSQAKYLQYVFLNKYGRLDPTTYNTNHDINFNSFNVYAGLVWQFKPGSEMSVVYQNSIYSSGVQIINNYFDDANYTFRSPQTNSLSVKIIYYLDYVTIKNIIREKKGVE
ncbi:MAG: DUF5916 domain-containing protein [Chitinophagales bacterium]